MKHIKLYEEHNISDNDFHINILNNGLRNANYETINFALDQGVVLDDKIISTLLRYFWNLRDRYDKESVEFQEMIHKMMYSIDTDIEERLDLRNLGLKNLDFLVRLPKLKRLVISSNKLKSLEGVQHLKQLIYLHADNNQISDISALKDNDIIIELDISKNQIKSLEALRSMEDLRYVSMKNNEIESLEPLKNSTKIYHISAGNNNITTLEPVKELISTIENVYLYDNPIQQEYETDYWKGVDYAGSDDESSMIRHYVTQKYNI